MNPHTDPNRGVRSAPHRSRIVIGALVLLLVGLTTAGVASQVPTLRRVARNVRRKVLPPTPHTAWLTASPESLGMRTEPLARLERILAERDTAALVVARGGHIVLESYDAGHDANSRIAGAALEKAVYALTLLLLGVDDGAVALDDPVSRWIPDWTGGRWRSGVTLFHLVTHSSGLEDVEFTPDVAQVEDEDWHRTYYTDRPQRFRLAATASPVLFEPGSRHQYCGLGFYPLAYALTSALRDTETPDLRSYFRERVARPLGIDDRDWDMNYGEAYDQDGLRLYGVSSGGRLTARAYARVAQLYLDHGAAGTRQLIDSALVDAALSNAGLPAPAPGAHGQAEPSVGLAWWVNDPPVFPSLPRDAAIAMGGGGRQVIVVVPSERLLAVRLGAPLGGPGEDDSTPFLEDRLFAPLMSAIDSPNPDPGPSRRVTTQSGSPVPQTSTAH